MIGTYDVFRGSAETSIRQGLQIPNNDPSLVVPAMAAVTRHLGFGITFSTTYEPPFAWARRLSTLDHLTKGRVGWNIVTSYLPNAARNFGLDGEVDHGKRYEIADEYLDVLYKLWEGSWDDDAIIADREHNVFADPAKIRPIFHEGTYFKVEGPHLPSPSRQRTPVLFSATASGDGTEFAGKHTEVVFTGGPTAGALQQTITNIRKAAVEAGRRADDVKFITQAGVIVGRTEAEARAKRAEYERLSDPEGYLAHASLTFDPTAFPPDARLRDIIGEDGNVGRWRAFDPEQTVGEFLSGFGAIGTEPAVRQRHARRGGRRHRRMARPRGHRRHQPDPVPLLRHRQGLHRTGRAGPARTRPAPYGVRPGRVPPGPHLRRRRPPARPPLRGPLPRRRLPARDRAAHRPPGLTPGSSNESEERKR